VTVPPYPVALKFQVRAASEITRGVGGHWDQFNVTFEPFENPLEDGDSYSVVVTVTNMKVVKRSTGSASPPDGTYFVTDAHSTEEAVATTSIADALSGGNCVFAQAGFPDLVKRTDQRSVERRMKCYESN